MLDTQKIIIGFTDDGNPIYALAGGGAFEFLVEDDDDTPRGRSTTTDPDDDDDDGDDGDDDGDDGDGDPGDADDWTPPTRAEWEALTRKAKSAETARAEAARRRIMLRENGINPRTGKRRTSPDQDDDQQGSLFGDDGGDRDRELARAAARASAETEQAYRVVLARTAVSGALAEAGWNGKGKTLIPRLIDLDAVDVDIDDDGTPIFEGLNEQIEDIRAEFPEWFRSGQRGGGQRGEGRRRATSSAQVRGAGAVDGGRTSSRGRPVATSGWRQTLDDRIAGAARRK